MDIFKTLLILLALCICAKSLAVRSSRSADDDDLINLLSANDDDDDDDDGDEYKPTTEAPQPLGIVSIKSRAIAMDRGLCREQSRYHPHYPRCQEYCVKLDHWMGMCRRDSCHCYS